jgi:hypothetical protein
MDLEETEAKNDCAGEGQQQFNRLTNENFLLTFVLFRKFLIIFVNHI